MAEQVKLSSIEGWLKELYPESPAKLVPEYSYFIKLPFDPNGKSAVGAHYNMPMLLSHESGVTVAGADADAFALNKPSSLQMKNAQVVSNQFLIRSKVSYEVVARASTSREAFGPIAAQILESMSAALSKRRELSYLYGRKALAVAASGSTSAFVVSTGTWAPMVWAGAEGTAVQVLRPGTSGNVGKYTNVIPAGSAVSADAAAKDGSGPTGNTNNSVCSTITAVNFDTRTLSIASTVAIAAADEIFFAGAVTGLSGGAETAFNGTSGTYLSPSYREMVGLDAVATSSSTLYGIDTASYGLFKPNTYAVSGSLTLSKLQSALLKSVGKGLEGGGVALVSYEALINMLNTHLDPTAITTSVSTVTASSKVGPVLNKAADGERLKLGAKGVDVITPAGNLKIVPHMFVKPEEAFIFQEKSLKRIGAQDVSFKTPGNEDEKLFVQMSDAAGYEVRQYSNEGLFIDRPGLVTKLTSIS